MFCKIEIVISHTEDVSIITESYLRVDVILRLYATPTISYEPRRLVRQILLNYLKKVVSDLCNIDGDTTRLNSTRLNSISAIVTLSQN